MLWKDFGNRLEFQNESLHALASETEALANIPVVDETSVTNHFDFDLNCSQTDLESRDLDSLNQALDPLGLELIPTNMPIKMLVVEKAP